MMSPLNPFVSNAVPGQDSSVFIYVGNILKRGLMPYKDTFDHKGPLLYLLEYAGLFISENMEYGQLNLPRGLYHRQVYTDCPACRAAESEVLSRLR